MSTAFKDGRESNSVIKKKEQDQLCGAFPRPVSRRKALEWLGRKLKTPTLVMKGKIKKSCLHMEDS